MNRTLLAILSTAITATAFVPGISLAAPVRSPYTPDGLVSAAYNGQLDGISSFGTLESDIAEDNVTPEDLIEVAVAKGRLSPERLSDRGFLNAVDAAMRNIVGDDN